MTSFRVDLFSLNFMFIALVSQLSYLRSYRRFLNFRFLQQSTEVLKYSQSINRTLQDTVDAAVIERKRRKLGVQFFASRFF